MPAVFTRLRQKIWDLMRTAKEEQMTAARCMIGLRMAGCLAQRDLVRKRRQQREMTGPEAQGSPKATNLTIGPARGNGGCVESE